MVATNKNKQGNAHQQGGQDDGQQEAIEFTMIMTSPPSSPSSTMTPALSAGTSKEEGNDESVTANEIDTDSDSFLPRASKTNTNGDNDMSIDPSLYYGDGTRRRRRGRRRLHGSTPHDGDAAAMCDTVSGPGSASRRRR